MRPQFGAVLAAAHEIKAHAPHRRVIFTVYERKRLGRDAAELAALADHLTAHGLVLEMLAGPVPRMSDPSGPGRLLFAFFAAMAKTERENIRESTLEGLDTPAPKGKHGGRPPVITGKRKGQSPGVASIYRALAGHEKAQAYPEAVVAAEADFAALRHRSAATPTRT